MFLARVKGHVVATAKDPTIRGQKLLLVEPLKLDYEQIESAAGESADAGGRTSFQVTGRAIVAVDSVGAGAGQLVLIAQGSSARMAEGLGKMPVDAVVLGIVDEAVVMGKRVV